MKEALIQSEFPWILRLFSLVPAAVRQASRFFMAMVRGMTNICPLPSPSFRRRPESSKVGQDVKQITLVTLTG